jgi:hypothetical protein
MIWQIVNFEKECELQYAVWDTYNNEVLGKIFWFPKWDTFIFEPETFIINTDSMKKISEFMERLCQKKKN